MRLPLAVLGVAGGVVLGEAVGDVGRVAGREVRSRAVALGVVGVGFGRGRGAARGQAL